MYGLIARAEVFVVRVTIPGTPKGVTNTAGCDEIVSGDSPQEPGILLYG